MKVMINNIAANSLESVRKGNMSTNGAEKQNIGAETGEKKSARCDRYDGVSVATSTYDLNDPSNTVCKGIFSENTSADVGERVIKDLELSDGYTPRGFSAKHIVSAFFRAEGASRYHVGLNYEIAELAKTEAWAIDHGQVNLSWATGNGSFNEDSVATIAAQVGRYIDSCHESGVYSDEEYAQLNDEITNCTKYWLDCITDARVGKRLRDEDAPMYSNPRILVRVPKRTADDYLLEAIQMRKIIEKENPFDINAFFAKIDQMRFNVAGIKSHSNESDSAKANTGSKS